MYAETACAGNSAGGKMESVYQKQMISKLLFGAFLHVLEKMRV